MKQWCCILLCAIVAMAASGCEQALFPEKLPRTQYERFDRLRGDYRPPVTYAPDGTEVLNLRARLTPYQQ